MGYNKMIGVALKELRIGKQIKVCDLVENIMSSSYYYKIERGENRITVDFLIQILNRMNVGSIEFSYLINDSYLNKVKLFEDRQREDKLKTLKKNNDIYIKHLEMLNNTKYKRLSQNDKIEIKKDIQNFMFEKETFYK